MMNRATRIALLLAAVGQLAGMYPVFADESAWVRVTPKESDAILANPGMGWETFHRTATEDKNLPAWIPSTIHYARWGWKTLEPEQGKIDDAFLDGVLEETRKAGQQLAFRVMCCSPYPRRTYHPEWLKDIGGKLVTTRHGARSEVEVPVLDDPKILAAHLDFIKRLGARYDGHPDITRLDLGSVGWWGEWHMSRSSNASMPTPETRKKIVDAYLAAFRKTPLVMLVGGDEMLKYAVKNGTGWRADSLGDLGTFSPTWNHMFHSYPKRIRQIQHLHAWKHGPIAFEPPAAVAEFVEKDWPLRWIFNYGLAVHGNSFSGKSGRLPDDDHFRQELERFLQRLGYRLVLKELRHRKQAKPGEPLTLATNWQNVGSAPCYQPYRLAWRLTGSDGKHRVFVSDVTVEKWLPGEIELFTEEFFEQPADLPPGKLHDVADSFRLPADMAAGEYALSVGIVGVNTNEPAVQLGIEGRDDDGWYPLSKLNVMPAALGPGDHSRSIKVDGRTRSYLVHVPRKYDTQTPTPVILVLHGAGTNAQIMVPFCGMNEKADEAGFITVYPNGTGVGIFLTWNAGGLRGGMAKRKPDDVAFIRRLLADLETVANVDPSRIYATGMSNGGMMCYRLAAELSERIAAIAPVAGTMAITEAKPDRPVPLIHFHGTADRLVPLAGPGNDTPQFLTFKSVQETVELWTSINHCEPVPIVEELADSAEDGTTVTKRTYPSKRNGSEVVLVTIVGGGHTWPGVKPPVPFLGKSTQDISANDMIWDFFQRHPLPSHSAAAD